MITTTTQASGPPLTPARRRLLLVVGPLLAMSVLFAGLIITQDLLPGTRQFNFSTEAPAAPALSVTTERVGVDLALRSGNSDRLRVFASGGYSGDEPTVTVAADGRRIDVRCPSDDSYDCGLRVEVEVPGHTAVTATGRSGEISAEGIDGALDLSTGEGRIEIIGGSGPINADTTSGRIQVEESTSRRVNVSTRSGTIDLGLFEPDEVEAATVIGNILIDLGPCRPYAVDVRSTEESTISVPVDPAAPRSIQARSQDGVIIECG